MGWLADVREHPDLQLLRADAQARVLAVARVVALCADWNTYCSRPTWERLCERTGLSRRTIARHLAWLREHQLLEWVERGTTADLSPGILQTGPNGERPANTATVYMLTAPIRVRLVALPHPEDAGAEHAHTGPVDAVEAAAWATHDTTDDPEENQTQPRPLEAVDISGTPSGFGFWVKSTHARETRAGHSGAGLRPALQTSSPMRRLPTDTGPEAPPWDLGSTPAGRKERLAASFALQGVLPVLRRTSAAHVAHLAREWWLAGWTPADIAAALGRRPDGTPWHRGEAIRHVPGWVRHRLAAWRHNPDDPSSPPGRSPSALAAAAAAHERAAARARAERRAAREAGTTPAAADWAARARAELAAATTRAEHAETELPAARARTETLTAELATAHAQRQRRKSAKAWPAPAAGPVAEQHPSYSRAQLLAKVPSAAGGGNGSATL